MENQLSLFAPAAPVATIAKTSEPTPAAALAALLAVLAPLYSQAQVADECCSASFHRRLVARLRATCPSASPAAVGAALRTAGLMP